MKRAVPVGLILVAVIIAIAFSLAAASGVLVDWLWFGSLGFGSVFSTIWEARVAAFAAATVPTWVILTASGLLAARTKGPAVRRLRMVQVGTDLGGLPQILEVSLERFPWRLVVVGVASLLSIFIGLGYAGDWETLLKWWYAVPFGQADPLFGNDLAFYVFTLPVWNAVRDWGLLIVVLAAMVAAGVYWGRGAIDTRHGPPTFSPAAIRHLSLLLAAFFLVKVVDYLLQRYGLLLSNSGVVFGAAYTDAHIRLPLLALLAGLSVLAMLLSAATVARADARLPVAAVVLVLGGSLIAWVLPPLFQSYRVKPDELRLESPYIANDIALTRYGFGLDRVSAKEFPAKGRLTPEVLAANDATIQNLRWWDPRPLLETYRQLQEIRLYYDFHDVDVDRYMLDGTYREVMLAARELDQGRLPPNAQTWINLHFKFTHGIGLAMSPVNKFDSEGLPVFRRQRHTSHFLGRTADRTAADLLWRDDFQLHRRGRRDERVRLSQGAGQRVLHLRRCRRRGSRQYVAPAAVRLVPRRLQAADQRQRHPLEPHSLPPPATGSHPSRRPVSRA